MGRGERVRALWGWRTAVEEEEAQRRRTWRERLHSAAREAFWAVCVMCDLCVCVCRILQTNLLDTTHSTHTHTARTVEPNARARLTPPVATTCRCVPRCRAPALESRLHTHFAPLSRRMPLSVAAPPTVLSLYRPVPLPAHCHTTSTPYPHTSLSLSLSHQPKHTKSRGRSSRRTQRQRHTKQKKTPHPKTKQRAGCGSVVTNLSQY